MSKFLEDCCLVLMLNPEFGRDFVGCASSDELSKRCIERHGRRLLNIDLTGSQVIEVHARCMRNYADEINNQGADMADLDAIFDALRNDGRFRNSFTGAAKGVGQRDAILDAIERIFGDEARRDSKINDRKALQTRFQYYLSTSEVIETKTRVKQDSPIQPTQPQQEDDTIMANSNIAVEVRTFIFGNDASNVTDDRIFDQIAGIEGVIAQLDKTINKPAKLTAKIAALQADIAALIAFVDARPTV